MTARRPWWTGIYDLPLRYKIVVPVVLLEIFVFLAAMRVTTSSVHSVASQSMHAEARSRLRLLGAAYLQMTLTGEQEYFRELVNVVSRAPNVVNVDRRPVDGELPTDTRIDRSDGTHVYTAWRRVQVFDEATDIGISFTDRGVVLAVNDARRRYSWILGLGVLLTTALLWVMILAITDPVTRVARAADRLAAGEQPPRFTIQRRDEVGVLAHAFETMADELHSTQEQLEELLADRTRRLEAMFHNLPVGVLQIDSNYTIRAVNPAMADMLGKPHDDIVGKLCFELVGHDGGSCDHCVLATPDQPISRHTCTLRHGTRNERVLDTTVVRVPGTNGNSSTVMELAHDVTEEIRLEAQLLQSSKLASIGQLASGLAHEINNPLGTILLRTDNLRAEVEELDLSEDILEDVDAIQRQASRVSLITQELLTFSRCTTIERNPVNINDVIQSAIILVGLRAEKKHVEISHQNTRDLVPILGNKTQLEQVVVNVLSNAIDASSNDSLVKVEAGSTRDENGGEVIEVCVDDRGRGIEPDDMERIFDPFYSTKDVGDGTGLGLSISYGIITSHGGTIDVSSRPGEGTVVWIRIPVAGSTAQDITGDRIDTQAPQNILEGTTQA
jgi:PAS domain S-box-containing protein